MIRASLPALSDDGMRAIVYTETTTGGFEGSRGDGYIFEKFDAEWVLRGRFAGWIS